LTSSPSPSLTIVVADEHPLTSGVRSVLEGWVALGLLRRDALWVSDAVDDARLLAGPRCREPGEEGERGEEGEGGEEAAGGVRVDLQARLAAVDVELVRVVALQVVGTDGTGAGLPAALASTRALLDAALSPRQQRIDLNLVVASPNVALSVDDSIDSGSKNIVVSAEDRRTDGSATVDLSVPDALTGHAALALATIGGLWPGMREGPFDRRTVGVSGDGRHVVVARCSGRVLLCEDIVEQLLDQLFERRNHGEIDPEIVDAHAATNPRRLGTDVAQALVAAAGITYRPPSAEHPPPARGIGLGEAIRAMFRHLWDRLTSAPRRALDRTTEELRRDVEGLAQQYVFGSESTMQIQFAKPGPLGGAADEEALQEAAERLAASWTEEQRVLATPETWRMLRASAFGIVDGSPLPAGVQRTVDDRVVVAHDLWAAVPDPAEAPLVVEVPVDSGVVRVELSSSDPALAGSALAALAQAPTVLQVTSGADDDPEARAAALDAAESAHQEVEEWVERRSGGMVWELGRLLEAELARATRAFRGSFERARSALEGPDEAGHARARRRFRRWCWLASVVVLIGIVIGLRGLWSDASVASAYYFAGLVGGLLLVCALAYIDFERRMFQLKHGYDSRLIAHRNALNAVANDAREVARLNSLCRQYRDWSSIIGWAVHHPEGTVVEPAAAAEVPDVAHPEALRLATGRPSDDFTEHLVALTARRVFARGWLTGLYSQASDAAMSRYRLRRGLSASASTVDPDNDTSEKGARRYLLERFQDGELSASWRREVRRALAAEFNAVPPTELFDQVSELPSRVAGADITDPSRFFGSLLPGEGVPEFPPHQWRPEAVVDRRHRVAETLVWAPPGLVDRPLGDAVHVELLDPDADDGPLRVCTLRMDLTDECEPHSLRAFAAHPCRPTGGGSPFRPDDIG